MTFPGASSASSCTRSRLRTSWTACALIPALQCRSVDFTANWATPNQHDYVVLDDESGPGIVSIGMFRYLPEDAWSSTTLDQLSRPDPPVAWLDEHVEDVLQRMAENYLTAMPVVERESGRFVGALTSRDILELMLNRGRA